MSFFKAKGKHGKDANGFDVGKGIVSHGTRSSDIPYAGSKRRVDAGRGTGYPDRTAVTMRRANGTIDMVEHILTFWKPDDVWKKR